MKNLNTYCLRCEVLHSKRRVASVHVKEDEIDVEDLIPNEPMVVTITHNGYVKRVPIKSYERQKRGGKGKVAVTTHDGALS